MLIVAIDIRLCLLRPLLCPLVLHILMRLNNLNVSWGPDSNTNCFIFHLSSLCRVCDGWDEV